MKKSKKPLFKRWWFWVLAVLIVLIVVGASGGSGDKDGEASAPLKTSEAAPSEPVVTPSEVEAAPARDNPLDVIALSAEEKRSVYREFDAALSEAYSSEQAASLNGEDAEKIENDLAAAVAESHGISVEDVNNIYSYGALGYLYDIDPAALSVQHGELQSATVSGTTLVVKAKISSSFSNKATIDQNYYNVCNLIQKQGCEAFDEIQYWAVSDMADGSEGKVISFTVGRDLIEKIAAGNFADNTLGDYLTDLWVLPSLLT